MTFLSVVIILTLTVRILAFLARKITDDTPHGTNCQARFLQNNGEDNNNQKGGAGTIFSRSIDALLGVCTLPVEKNQLGNLSETVCFILRVTRPPTRTRNT